MIDILKYNFIKAEKNMWMGWKDYVGGSTINEYGYYLHASIHAPYTSNSTDVTFDMYKIIVHRSSFDRKDIERRLAEGESKIVYYGLIESEEYFEKLLINLGIELHGR